MSKTIQTSASSGGAVDNVRTRFRRRRRMRGIKQTISLLLLHWLLNLSILSCWEVLLKHFLIHKIDLVQHLSLEELVRYIDYIHTDSHPLETRVGDFTVHITSKQEQGWGRLEAADYLAPEEKNCTLKKFVLENLTQWTYCVLQAIQIDTCWINMVMLQELRVQV